MSELTHLQTSEPFASAQIVTDRIIRTKNHLPPSVVLATLDELFTGASEESLVLFSTTAGELAVYTYLRNPTYEYGETTYVPNMAYYLEDDPTCTVVSIKASGSKGSSLFRGGLNPTADTQYNYHLCARTWTPGGEVARRIIEHDRLVSFGVALLEQFSISPHLGGRDLKHYKVQKMVGE